jgi:serine/threonine-protein kinase
LSNLPATEPARAIARTPAKRRASLAGRTLAGKYVLDTLLGEGAMGAVYKAHQITLEKTIAIKVMHLDLVADEMFAARFHREATAASALDHPNSIRILDFGEEVDGLLYIAMEFLDGCDLLHIIERESPLTPQRIVDILAQVLSALSMAHEMGTIHRDLKPENIMVLRRGMEEVRQGDLVKVCDFGLAKVAESLPEELPFRTKKRRRQTTAGFVVGTPEYMSPEQGRGDVLDARSDLYSVGVILYYLLTGRLPFDAPTPLGIVMRHQHAEPTPPSSLRSGVNAGLEVVCLRAMQKRPAERYRSAREMRAALLSVVDGVSHPSGAVRVSLRTPSPLTPLPMTHVLDAAMSSGVAAELAQRAKGSDSARVESSAPLLARTADPMGLRLRIWRFGKMAVAVAVGMVVLCAGVRHGLLRQDGTPAALLRRGQHQNELPGPSAAAVAERLGSVTVPPPAPPLPVPFAPPLATAVPIVDSVPLAWRSSPPVNAPARPIPPPARIHRAPSKGTAAPPPPPSEPSAGHEMLAPSISRTTVEAPPPVAPAPQATPPFDPARARVVLGPAQIATGGARTSSVTRVLRGAHDKISRCYQSSASATSPEGSWNLRILTDDEGNVSDAHLDGPLPREAKDCISNALQGAKINTDTGAVTADVRLTFKRQ